MPEGTVLVIDDEEFLRQAVARTLELEGYTVLQAANAYHGLAALREHAAEVLVVLSDVKLPDGRGLDLLPRYKALAPLAEVILLTAYGTIADSVQAMKNGAFDYLTKSDADEQLVVIVDRAADKARLQRRVADLEQKVGAQYSFDSMVGHAPALEQAKKIARQVAPTDATVLLEGPTGAGKELFAQAIHQASGRKNKPFVALNCSAYPKDLLESELFGYKKGAFTGANVDKKGMFEEANGGTLFLDEIGELEGNAQAKLLRALETQEFVKLGDSRPTRVNVRLLAATNRNLKQEVAEGRFRSDLYYRLNVFPLAVPPLRGRPEDILPLATHFLQRFSKKLGKPLTGFTTDTARQLLAYPWPGNVRELEHVLERAAILTRSPTLALAESLAPAAAPAPATPPPVRPFAEAAREVIEAALAQASGRIRGPGGAAELLGIKPTTLEARMKKLGVR